MIASAILVAATLLPGKTEVCTGVKPCGVISIAAQEASEILSQSLGAEVPVVESPTPGRVSLVLGACALSDAAGVTTNGLVRDAFRIKAAGDRIYLVGVDDRTVRAKRVMRKPGIWINYFERATMFAVYEFLERFAGCRFYFPGEIGTVVPKKQSIEVPDGTYVECAPDFTSRRYSFGTAPSPQLSWWRLRMETRYNPCCHGMVKLDFIERFAKTHPEYFALMPNGKRHLDPKLTHPGQLCHSSKAWDELYEDAKCYLTGGSPSKRGLKRWGSNFQRRSVVDLMPQDGMVKCCCDKCRAVREKATDQSNWASDLIWGNVAELARRLTADGIAGDVNMMAYRPYRRVPDFELPKNVHVMVAERGPWSAPGSPASEKADGEIRGWAEKLGHKVWIWTYPHKWHSLALPGVPHMAPHAMGEYYKRVSPWIFGAYAESETDSKIFSYLNLYVFSRVCWNTKTDVDAVIDEHHRLMFGAAAREMAAFYRLLEEKWTKSIAGNTVETDLGPVGVPVSDDDLFSKIYPPTLLDKCDKVFDAAEGKVAQDPDSLKRVRFMRRELLDPIRAKSKAYFDSFDVKKRVAEDAASPRPNILPNGDFSAPIKNGRFFGGWHATRPGEVEMDTEVFVSPPQSVKLSSTDGNPVFAAYIMKGDKKLVPGRRYRLSYCVRLANVAPKPQPGAKTSGGGVSVSVWMNGNNLFPAFNHFRGTVDWMYRSYEFTAAEYPASKNPYIRLQLRSATGEAWFDDVRLEELDATP